jgi:hypothetical protein
MLERYAGHSSGARPGHNRSSRLSRLKLLRRGRDNCYSAESNILSSADL